MRYQGTMSRTSLGSVTAANEGGKLTAASSVFFPASACRTLVWICGPSFELAVGAG
jgi:hypothetical protein